ncbi:unnamed protein product [Pylaiella littoralis]
MLVMVMRFLMVAHPDKAFDVVATVCDGAAEHCSFQTHAAILGFVHWIKGPNEGSFASFNIGFRHPVHLHEVFNMSDPMHILKKIVNALWHSDIPCQAAPVGDVVRHRPGRVGVFSVLLEDRATSVQRRRVRQRQHDSRGTSCHLDHLPRHTGGRVQQD